jgi:pyruvate/2-oxoglutarate dehydrogenase complex dihydrolipoamide acyltransferase (E2) component
MAQAKTKRRSGGARKASEKTEKYRFAKNVGGQGTVAEHVYEAYATETTAERAGGEPDVLLVVPVLKVDRIHLELDDLYAHLSLRANVLDLVKLNVGIQAKLGKVRVDIEGVEAQALAKVRLDHVAAVVDRVMTTIDRNPELLESVGKTLEEVGSSAGDALGETGKGVEKVAEGAGEAVEGVGSGLEQSGGQIGQAAGELGHDAGQAVGQLGQLAQGGGGGKSGGIPDSLKAGAVLVTGSEEADATQHGKRAAVVAKEAAKTVAKELGTATQQAAKELGERRKQRQADRENATEAAMDLADELHVDLDEIEGSGKDGRITVNDVRAADRER